MTQVLDVLPEPTSDPRFNDRPDSVPDTSCDDDYTHPQPVLDSLPAELSAEEHDEAVRFVKEYSHVFSKSEFDLGRTSLYPCYP